MTIDFIMNNNDLSRVISTGASSALITNNPNATNNNNNSPNLSSISNPPQITNASSANNNNNNNINLNPNNIQSSKQKMMGLSTGINATNSSVGSSITFDEVGKVRVLDPLLFENSEKLKEQCSEFLGKMKNFNETVANIMSAMQDQAQVVEREKYKAIGLKNLIAKEIENRREKQHSLNFQIKYFQSEVNKLMTELESLSKLELEQNTIIDNLMGK